MDAIQKHINALSGDRSPLCESNSGRVKDTYPDNILAPVLKALIEKTNINPAQVGDIVVGSVLAPSSERATECRMVSFYVGFPGVGRIYENHGTRPRLSSSNGNHIRKCRPTLQSKKTRTRSGCSRVTISVDDWMRPGVSLADLAKLKPVFKKDGSTTAETFNQVSDGARVVLLIKRNVVVQKGLPILGVFSMKKSGFFAASMAAASATTAISGSSSKNQTSHEDHQGSSKHSEDSSEKSNCCVEKFAPRFDGLRFIETLVTAHR
ncbi:unnamed protein product [Lactuca saligna]|uniref:Thiolase N-terminal domain-containing protein n=1 Tax=Lactuca saligna TaxID=75948 RepID=A0AA35YU30_LACSI|nr:unnamed protein product [Lactuca saligna]